MGTWYEIRHFPQVNQTGINCGTQELYLQENGVVRVINSGVNLASAIAVSFEGSAVLSFPDEDPLRAMLNVTFTPGMLKLKYEKDCICRY